MTGTQATRRLTVLAAVVVGAAILWVLRPSEEASVPEASRVEAAMQDVLAEPASDSIRAACGSCHVFPEPNILPRAVWPTAVRGMFQMAEDRGTPIPVPPDRAIAWYVLQAPEALPPAPGRTDAGPGPIEWETEEWSPDPALLAEEERPAVTHLEGARLFGGTGEDLLVSDVATDRVYALRPYADGSDAVVLGSVPDPGRLTVTDLDENGELDVVVAALGNLKPTNERVGSLVWLRRSGPERFEEVVLADGLGRVADVRAVDLQGSGRTDLVVAVFGWLQNGGLLWFENVGTEGDEPQLIEHVIDARSGFTDVRAADLDADGRLDLIAVIAQEFQEVMVYWARDGGYVAERLFQAPNPDWGYTGLTVGDLTGDGRPDVIVANGDNLDLTSAKPHHGVALIENLGSGRFEYRHLTSFYGAHRPVMANLTGSGAGLLVGAYLPPTVDSPEPGEALLWLDRSGPTELTRRVLKRDGTHHMTMAAGDFTGDGRVDLALGQMDLGVVDPSQAHQGDPLSSFVTIWRNVGSTDGEVPPSDARIDWMRGPDTDRPPT